MGCRSYDNVYRGLLFFPDTVYILHLSLSLSVLMAIFPGEPGLAGFIEAKDDGSGGDNWNYKTCKAPVKSSPPTNQHPTFYRPDSLPVTQPTTNSIKALHGTAPEYLSELLVPVSTRSSRRCLRSSDSNKLVVSPVKLSTYVRRSFTASGPIVWNSLPEYLRDPLIRLGAILKHTSLFDINTHTTS